MASDLTFIPALSGEEIVVDICGLIAEKLRSDCNLRPIDGYAGGYKATVKIHLEAFGLDQAVVDYTVEADETGPVQDTENPVDLTEPDVLIDTEVEVPVEPDLSLVRERGQQPTPDFEAKPEITADGPVMPSKRKYSRRLKALAVAQGGAAEPLNE
jgi:hypothetical protein